MIPVAGPWITEKEIAYVTDAVTHAWYDRANEYIDRFENAFKSYLGRKYAISLPSCTSALHLSLLALEVGVGDEVIVPDATWIASAAPISYVGATPIFVDIDTNTWCLSAETVAPYITKNTKAIIAVNLYGHMPDYDPLWQLAAEYSIPIIEDAAQSIGSTYKGNLAGGFGITSCFSFHGSKTLVTGEGGMLVTNDKKIYAKCMLLRDHGRLPEDTLFQNIQIGYKYKMSSLQAALGLAQLERIEELVNKKREIFNEYSMALKKETEITLNPKHRDIKNSYWMTTAVFNPRYTQLKVDIIEKLKKNKIASRPFFDPLSSLKAYENSYDIKRARAVNQKAYSIAKRAINLPSCLNLKKSDIAYIAKILKKNLLPSLIEV
ncbi:MAG: DegT/DnrJ/EryC1/StrS family aminotransferase [Rickettsia endosymbiont of Ixodes persulcatus]|nr:DegT/DnrJ/EryC1/StrS family aminotransferase [Rickettsia endosymbiont of Ixodes persulcatus]